MNIHSIGFDSVYDESYSFSYQPQRNEYLFLLAKREIVLTVDGITEIYPSNTMILFDDRVKWEYGSNCDFLICDWMKFDTEGENDYIESVGIVTNLPVLHADDGFISHLVRNILSEYYSQKSRRTKMTDSLIKMLLMKMGENFERFSDSQQTSDLHYNALCELREKIYRNPQMKWNVDTMAADVNMSRSHFQHVYSEMFKISCMSDVINSKIEKAKEILSETSCTVSQVAAMCGYDNEEHFMRQFKKIVGVTPTGYRKNS